MNAMIRRFLTILFCYAPLTALSANITYFLKLPDVLGYDTWGTITTDGAAAPTAADVVDWQVTLWSVSTKQSFVLTPQNATLDQFLGVTATPGGLFLGSDNADYVTWSSNQKNCLPDIADCYGLQLGLFLDGVNNDQQVLVTAAGFNNGLTQTWSGFVPAPFATRIPLTNPPKSFRILRHIIGLETTPTLLQKVAAAQRYYDANDSANTCTELTQLITQTQAIGTTGAIAPDVATEIVAYANSIKMQIACSGCGS
jgi:hypothetical protein